MTGGFGKDKRRFFFRLRPVFNILFAKRTFLRLAIVICSVSTLIILARLHDNSDYFGEAFLDYTSSWGFSENEYQLSEILSLDISDNLKLKAAENSPITNKTCEQNFYNYTFDGFISNVDASRHEFESKDSSQFDDDIEVKDLDLASLNQYQSNEIGRRLTCKDLKYSNTLQFSNWTTEIKDDMIQARRYVHAMENEYSSVTRLDNEDSWTEEKITKDRWFSFGAASVWLEQYQCYVVYSRLIYSPRSQKNHPKLSMLRGQAFDKNWNEIHGKRIPYNDVNIPSDLDDRVKEMKVTLGITDCDSLVTLKEQEECQLKAANVNATAQRQVETALAKFYVTYPLVFDIPAVTNGDYKGPEDPKVLLKSYNDGSHEPVVVYNQFDEYFRERRMFVFFPHKKNDPIVKMSSVDFEQTKKEKNWTPFFHYEYSENKLSRGFIHFIYTFLPLEILKCSLDDGTCYKVFRASTLELPGNAKYQGMRGGTQYISLPSSIPKLQEKQVWIGFPKLHVRNCGCGRRYYRPMLSVLVESDGIYHQELVAPVVDFGLDVTSWDLKGSYCFDINIMSPNSINYWEIKGQDLANHKFDDYLSLSVSEADSMTRVITLKGLLNYVLEIYEKKAINDKIDLNDDFNGAISKSIFCIGSHAYDQCKSYAKFHEKPKDKAD